MMKKKLLQIENGLLGTKHNPHLFRWGLSYISMPTGLEREIVRYLKEINQSLKKISISLQLSNKIKVKKLLKDWTAEWDDDIKEIMESVDY